MHCPNCGKTLPDNAAFCGGCGKRVKRPAAQQVSGQAQEQAVNQAPVPAANQAPKPASNLTSNQAPRSAASQAPSSSASPSFAQSPALQQPASDDRFVTAAIPSPASTQSPTASGASAFSVVGIIARVASVATMVCMLLPWVSVPGLQQLGNLGSLLGFNTAGDYSYRLIDLREVADFVDEILPSLGIGPHYMMFFIGWLIAIIAIVAGLIVSFFGKKTARPLIVGGAAAVLLAGAWILYIMGLNADFMNGSNQLIGMNIPLFELQHTVMLTVLFGIVTIVLAALDKPAA